jgi:oxygen-independent coproporphyrinogen-3 oxidase
VLSPLDYVRRVQGGKEIVAEREEISRATELSETMIMGLRLCRGVSFAEFEERFHIPVDQIYGEQIREMIELGLLEVNGTGVRLTPRGRLLANDVFERFLPSGPD